MGTRYVAALPAGEMLDLPPAAQTAINTSVTSFLTQDRGHIRLGMTDLLTLGLSFCPLARYNAI